MQCPHVPIRADIFRHVQMLQTLQSECFMLPLYDPTHETTQWIFVLLFGGQCQTLLSEFSFPIHIYYFIRSLDGNVYFFQ